MKALPIPEPRRKTIARSQDTGAPETTSTAESWMMGLLIVLVPALGGAAYQALLVSKERTRLAGELAEARAMAREVVGELVQTRLNLESRETQVDRLLEATTLADQQAQELRGALADWQDRHESLASAADRKIEELRTRSTEVERRLEDERTLRESERARLEQSLSSVSNQLAATDMELRDTRDFAREAAQRNEHLERGAWELSNRNDSLSSRLSSVQSDLASAQSEASSAESGASSAESERARAERELDRAKGAIVSLRNVVEHHRREEARDHHELARPPAEQPRAQVEAPRQHSGGPPERREPGGRRAK